jgi:hypothetical protein
MDYQSLKGKGFDEMYRPLTSLCDAKFYPGGLGQSAIWCTPGLDQSRNICPDEPRLRLCSKHGVRRHWPDPDLVGYWVCYQCQELPEFAGLWAAVVSALSRTRRGLTVEQLHWYFAGRYPAAEVDDAIDLLCDWTEWDDYKGPVRLTAAADPCRLLALN